MDGHASSVALHPSSILAGHEDDLNWVMYREVVWTSKVYMPVCVSVSVCVWGGVVVGSLYDQSMLFIV
jgi:hypothetical protein